MNRFANFKPMRKIVLTYSLLFFALLSFSQEDEDSAAVTVQCAYTGDFFTNMHGGIKTGAAYLGAMDFALNINTGNLGLWQNGELYIQVENTHGATPSGDYMGDLQTASNIENGNYSYLYEFWYKQSIKNLSFQFGVIDLNADYFTVDADGLFLNSSFGIQPSASINIPVPIFPMNAPGVNLKYDFTHAISLQTGVWDGDPGNLDDDPYNIEWSLSKEQGFLSVTELHLKHRKINEETHKGIVKLGFTYHSGIFSHLTNETQTKKGNIELHLITGQSLIYREAGEKGKLDAFLQLGVSPYNTISQIPFYMGVGITYTGIMFKDARDIMGFAVAYSRLSNLLTNIPEHTGMDELKSYEMALELTYNVPLTSNISIQPDLQYIVNTGADKNLNNVFAGFLRIIIEK